MDPQKTLALATELAIAITTITLICVVFVGLSWGFVFMGEGERKE